MAERADYADRLRENFLALALVPLAGFATATFWLREALDRTSRLGGDVIASTALARLTRTADDGKPDPATELIATDLLAASRTYVRAMVRLPSDVGVYFTGELEHRFNALLQRIQPDPEKNLTAYADTELQQLSQEVDRLLVLARAEADRPLPAVAAAAGRPGYKMGKQTARKRAAAKQAAAGKRAASGLAKRIDELRTRVEATRPKKGRQVRAGLALGKGPLGPRDAFASARARTRARMRLLDAVREAETLVPAKTKALRRIGASIEKQIPAPRPGSLTK